MTQDPAASTDPPDRRRPLSAREAGSPVDETLYEGVPDHLVEPLQRWVGTYLTFSMSNLGDRIAATVRFRPHSKPGSSFLSLDQQLGDTTGALLLDVIDAALQLDPGLRGQLTDDAPEDVPPWAESPWPASSPAGRVQNLDDLLRDGGSAYQVFWRVPVQLVRRIPPTVVDAAAHAMTTAPPAAAALLAGAWRAVFGIAPNPTTGYRDAVRAVEQLACPLVLPHDDRATLGKVIGHLKQGGSVLWRFVLVDRDDTDTIDPLVAILERLWTGQVSRHGGARTSRDQTQAEAETAVHLAATLVQLLSTGALTRREEV